MSALPPIADIRSHPRRVAQNVFFDPQQDSGDVGAERPEPI